MTNIRKPYDKHVRFYTEIRGESRTKQSFQDECNINTIMAKYAKTGLIDHVGKYGGSYGDLPAEVDYQTALNAIMKAKECFASLPAGIRTRFENDPAQFLEFVEDPANAEEMIEIGLAEAKDSKTPLKAADGAKPSEGAPTGEEPEPTPEPPKKAKKAP